MQLWCGYLSLITKLSKEVVFSTEIYCVLVNTPPIDLLVKKGSRPFSFAIIMLVPTTNRKMLA